MAFLRGPKMKAPFFTVASLAFALRLAAAAPEDVSYRLQRIQRNTRVPAVAAAVVVDGQVAAYGAAGLRNAEGEVPATREDLWHLGSCTKSMTASVVAMLVEEGKLSWETTVGEIFADLGDAVLPAWREVTIEQLLVHRGGAPHDPPADLWKAARERRGTASEQRAAFAKGLLAHEPEKPPGTHWTYSDSGYAIIGAMMERATGKPWEELMRERLFVPLGLKSAGFGEPASPGKLDQPWGHTGEEAPYKPIPPGPDADNPPAIGPAATVHMTIADFARYAAWHVAGARGEARGLTAESFKKLHTPPDGQEYAMGWAVTKRRWAGGTALMHNGDNTMFYAVMWLGPAANTCFVAACNADGPEATEACDEAITMLINDY
jgi:CubicO group peptidase (beta-lactamase class C family)